MNSKFARKEEIFSDPFWEINKELLKINSDFDLKDHKELNESRFSWFSEIKAPRTYYGARFWEYPYAILAADLRNGLKCADVGCGTTPFTAYLAAKVGAQNVTGIDPDLIEGNESRHSSFGISREFINALGINFDQNLLTNISAKDETFDRVFCISVLEHIEDPIIQFAGIREMVRVLKPGGRLILTMDLGIQNPICNPLDFIKFSGLTPVGTVDLTFPDERFADYGSFSMDVYGLVLEKSENEIYLDYQKTKKIPMYNAFERFVNLAQNYSLSYNHVLVARDYSSRFGLLKVILKTLLNKY